MLDRKYIVENVALVRENCVRRGVTCDVDRIVQLESDRRKKLQEAEELNRLANEASKAIGGGTAGETRRIEGAWPAASSTEGSRASRARSIGSGNP